MTLELKQQIRCEVVSLRMNGYIWLVTEYGMETPKLFTIILDNGVVYEAFNNDIIISDNYTLGRGDKERLIKILNEINKD